MKITSFNPQIITKDAEAVVRLFEALGFERRHIKEDIGDLSVTGIRMKDENGFVCLIYCVIVGFFNLAKLTQ